MLACSAGGPEISEPDAAALAPAEVTHAELETNAPRVVEAAEPHGTNEVASPPADPPTPLGSSDAPPRACPSEMVLVDGEYCPEPIQRCLHWLDPPGPFELFRCAKYAPAECGSAARVHLRFCIDRDEFTPEGETLPVVHQSWSSARDSCALLGKRLCMESEWQLACEGPDMHPYPYGDGLTRDATACNIDRTDLGRPNAGLHDLRTPAGSHPRCVSPYGVHDMSGNVEEWATLDHPIDPNDRSTMKGAWWLPGRNTCRARTTGHGETYEGPQVGIRCCAEPATP